MVVGYHILNQELYDILQKIQVENIRLRAGKSCLNGNFYLTNYPNNFICVKLLTIDYIKNVL